MSAVARLTEKLSLAILGEKRNDVLVVLASFTTTLLEQWGVSLDTYIDALKEVAQVSDQD